MLSQQQNVYQENLKDLEGLLYEKALAVLPYASNEEYIKEILKYINVKILAYYCATVEEPEKPGQYRFRDRVIYKQDIEKILIPEISEETAIMYNDVSTMAEEFYGHIKARCQKSTKEGTVIPLEYLFTLFQLSELEEHIVLFALAPEIDNKFERIYGFLQDDSYASLLTLDLAARLYWLDPDISLKALQHLTESDTLFKYFFLDAQRADRSFLSVPLKLDKRITDYALNIYSENTKIEKFSEFFSPGTRLEAPLTDREVSGRITNYVKEFAVDGGRRILFFLYGPPGAGKKFHITHFCNTYECGAIFVNLKLLAEEKDDFDANLRRICMECIIKDAALVFTNFEAHLEDEQDFNADINELLKTVASFAKFVFLVSALEWKPQKKLENYIFIPIALNIPDNITRKTIWETFAQKYDIGKAINLAETANKFLFTPGQIERSLEAAHNISRWNGHNCITEEDLFGGCYGQIVHKLGEKAAKVQSKYRWDDLILPDIQKTVLKIACAQVSYRHVVYNQWGFDAKLAYGRGLSILFSGPPGTGKTMAAQVIANELNLEIYKIDLSGVVSKYIGETEKNLKELFDEAKKSQAILFFDEADALFGKRTEVKDSHDKSANMETAFLLQKMEEYDGIVVLATNFLQNFDDSFKRRIKFVVEFPFPDAQYRHKLWKSMFPAGAPASDDIDFDYLAEKFHLSGSNIKNVVVNAAFLAASEETEIDMRHIMVSIKNEYAKSNKILLKEDLGEYYYLY